MPTGEERDHRADDSAPLIDLVDWDNVWADGALTEDQIDAELRAKGLDPAEFDHLYQ